MTSAPLSSPRGLREYPRDATGSQRSSTGGARRRSARRRGRLVRALVGLVALVLLIVWIASSGGGVAAPARPKVRVTLPPVAVVDGAEGAVPPVSTPHLPWPKTGGAALAVPAVGYTSQSGAEHPVPVASMTKIMTAYLVLEDHPLALGEQGPRVTITPADASQFGVDTVTDQSNVLVQAGEVLTEYQMLEALLVHSANDVAYALACWDAGSLAAFVDKMNATAKALGMESTHFADASGFSRASRSTAADLLRVAAAAMADPVFAQIVSRTSATLPLAGTVGSYTPLIGKTGVVGVKSGFTTAAGGGDVLAYRTAVDGHPLIALAAVTSQEMATVLTVAGKEALALAKDAAARVREVTVAAKGEVVAKVKVGKRTVPLATSAGASLLALSGDTVHQVVQVRTPRGGTKKGTVVGSATFTLGDQRVSVPVLVAERVPRG